MATTDDTRVPDGHDPPQTPPAGWYPDPESPSQWRYWDGGRWTEYREAAAISAPPPATTRAAPQPRQRRPWYRRPGRLVAIGAVIAAAIGAFILINQQVTTNKRASDRAHAVASIYTFNKVIKSAHNRSVAEGNALIACWNESGSPQQAAARCGSSCTSCTETAQSQSKRLALAYSRSPDYVRKIYRDLYRMEQRHLTAVASLGTVTQDAFDAVKRGDMAGFYSRYQGRAQALVKRTKRLQARIARVARRTATKAERYLRSI